MALLRTSLRRLRIRHRPDSHLVEPAHQMPRSEGGTDPLPNHNQSQWDHPVPIPSLPSASFL